MNLNLSHRRRGRINLICGVDEVGRGALAGPVVGAAVVFPPRSRLAKMPDSKKLSPRRREEFFGFITARALGIGVGFISAEEIDQMNVFAAALKAMHRACERLSFRVEPELVLVDGRHQIPDLPWPQNPFPHADEESLQVAAASIIAKVLRDRYMQRLHQTYPDYGFAVHKGYSTRHHLANLRRLGPCPVHRKSFGPCAQCGPQEVQDIPIT